MSPERIRPGSAGNAGGPGRRPAEEPTAEDVLPEQLPADAPAAEDVLPEEEPIGVGDETERDQAERDRGELAPAEGDQGDLHQAATDGGAVDEEPVPFAGPPATAPSRRHFRRRVGGDEEAATLEEEPGEGELLDVLAGQARPMRWYSRLYRGQTSFDFVGRRRIWFTISTIVIAAGIVSLATRGLNLGIEFVGGTSWTVTTKTATTAQTQAVLTRAGVTGETVTILGSPSTGSRSIEVDAKLPKGQSATAQTAEANRVSDALAKLPGVTGAVSVESVGPSWGGQITQKALEALIVFFLLIALYISIFFEWRMALAAIIAVAHDILVTVGIYSLTGLEVTPDTVVAFLTILGYSLYDTIVVFDRVRDNIRHLSIRDRITFTEIVNLSMNQTLARSLNTSLVAIMPILAVLVLGAQILGATTLQYFGLALFVGLTTGAYSSIFIASPLVALLKERQPEFQRIRERLEARGGERLLLTPAAIAAGSFTEQLSSRRGRRAETVQGRIRPGAASAQPVVRPGAAHNGEGEAARDGDVAPAPRAASGPQRPGPPPRRPPARSRHKGGRR